MRTKTLLMAGAALAVSLATSQAQVYSANIVGYANVVIAGGGNSSLIANPFDDGNGNQLTNLLNSLPNKSQVTTWNTNTLTFDTPIQKGSGVWGSSISLPPGLGFFVKNGVAASPAITNTFVGTVVVNVGVSLTNSVQTGINLVGSPIPYAGDATVDPNINLGGVLPNKSQLSSWNVGTQLYDTPDQKGSGVWGSAFSVSVGQGFLVNAKSGTNWVQTLQP